jgi:hypothetical protein
MTASTREEEEAFSFGADRSREKEKRTALSVYM